MKSVTNVVDANLRKGKTIENITNGGKEILLGEDLSFSSLQEDISTETSAPNEIPIQCDWLDSRRNQECTYKSIDKGQLMNHISSHLEPKQNDSIIEVENILSCDKCDFDTEFENDLKKHNEINVHIDVMTHGESRVINDNTEVCDDQSKEESANIVQNGKHKDDVVPKTSENIEDTNTVVDDVQIDKETTINENNMNGASKNMDDVESNTSDKAEDTRDRVYICGECGKSFENAKDVDNHLKNHETNETLVSKSVPTFKCDQCDFMFLKNDELREHKIAAHKLYSCIYVCNGCNYKTSRITTFWAHKLNTHGDGPLEEKNTSYGNLFLNVLASQQENIIDDITKIKSENMRELQNLKKGQDSLLNNMEVLTHKMNYLITNSEQVLADNRSTYQTNLEKFREMGIGMKAINEKIGNIEKMKTENIGGINFHPPGRSNLHPTPVVQQPVPPKMKGNILIVGTSLTNKLNKQVIQNVTECKVNAVKAFTIDAKDGAVRPELNHKRIVPTELSKQV